MKALWLGLCGVLLAGAAGAASLGVVDRMAGVYKRRFQNAMVSGETYTSEDVVEIVKVTADTAYVRAHLDYANGHSCGIYGIARRDGDGLTYRNPVGSENRECRLHVALQGKSLLIDDDGGSCFNYCGVRGTLSKVQLPAASKRPIRYMARLLKSEEYKAAMDEYRGKKGN